MKSFDIISIDLITNLLTTKRGNKHIIVAIDNFSKYVELKALPNRTSKEVTNFVIENILCRYGAPR